LGFGAASAELSTYIKKISGKFERAEGIRVFPTFDDHIFRPVITVTDTEQEISFSGWVYLAKLTAQGCDIYVNFDRPIATDEYAIIFKDTTKLIGRKTSKIYVRAPVGLSGTLRFEGLVLNA